MQLDLPSICFFLSIFVLLLSNNNDEVCTIQVTESSPLFPGFEVSKEKAYIRFSNRNFILESVLHLEELEEENVD